MLQGNWYFIDTVNFRREVDTIHLTTDCRTGAFNTDSYTRNGNIYSWQYKISCVRLRV